MMAFDRLSIVLSTHPAQFNAVAYKGDLEANLVKIASWGYSGVELAIRDPTLIDADKLQHLISSTKLEIPALGTGQAFGEEGLSFTNSDKDTREAAVLRIVNHIKLAKHFDATVIIGLIRGITQLGQSADQSMFWLIECLEECMNAADTFQVRLALEPLNRYETDMVHTVDEGLELIDQVGSPNLGLLLDTFHMNIEEQSIEKSIQLAGEHIFHFHVADSNRWYPGAGHLNFVSILDALKSADYRGWISGEFMPLPNADTAAHQSLIHLTRCLSHLRPD
jgi:sugar phosphate isomerase/epimerase